MRWFITGEEQREAKRVASGREGDRDTRRERGEDREREM